MVSHVKAAGKSSPWNVIKDHYRKFKDDVEELVTAAMSRAGEAEEDD